MSRNQTCSTPTRADLHSRVTDTILKALEQGVRPWLAPWTTSRITRPLRHNGEPYRGINILMLWAAAVEHGYTSPVWMTFRQALELKAHVSKGQHGTLVVYADHFKRTDTDDTGEEIERAIPFLKAYTVFNVAQIEGLPERFHVQPAPQLPVRERIEAAEHFLKATGANIHHGGDRAFYAPALDHIQLPPFEVFHDAESYYATALHELTHWTRHPSRLARDLGRQRHGDEGYAREELVAELGAAFLCADLDIAASARDDHAAYIGAWLKILSADPRAIFEAAAHAQRATDFLHGLQKHSA